MKFPKLNGIKQVAQVYFYSYILFAVAYTTFSIVSYLLKFRLEVVNIEGYITPLVQ